MTAVLSVISAKGGVGKTTTAANIAAALAKRGHRITVVDGNITTPNLSIHLGMPTPPVTIHDVFRGASMKKAIYRHPSGMYVVPASLSAEDLQVSKPELLKTVITKLLPFRGKIIVDGAAGLGREARTTMMLSDSILLVTNPNLPAVTDAMKAAQFAQRRGLSISGLVVNRARGKKHEMTRKEIEDMMDLPVLVTVPEDEAVPESIKAKVPVVKYAPRSKAARAFNKLAAKLVNEEYYERPSLIEALLDWMR